MSIISKVITLGRILIPTIESDHQWIHEGRTFSLGYEFTLSGATPQYLHLVLDKPIHLHGVKIVCELDDNLITLLQDPVMNLDASPDEVPFLNNNRMIPNNSVAKAYSNSTYVSGGTVLCGHHIYGVEGRGAFQPVGGFSEGPWEWVLNPAYEYAFKVERPGETGTAKVALELMYYYLD